MLPGEWRGVGEQRVRHGLAPGAQVLDSVGEAGRVPVDDGRDHQVQPRGPELLRILAAVGDAPLLERADDLGQCVALLAFVQAGVAALSELRRLQPVQHEKGALDTAELLDGQVELVLPLVGGESFQHGQRCHGAGLQ